MSSQEFRTLALLLSTCGPLAALADPVTVSSLDSQIIITGEITSYDDETVTILTGIGELILERASLQCEGADCPPETASFDLAMAVTDPSLTPIIRSVAESYAAEEDNSVILTAGPDGQIAEVAIRVSPIIESPTDASIKLRPSDLTDGFVALAERDVDLTLASMQVTPGLAERYAAAGGGDLRAPGRERVIALDAVVPVVHPDNTIRSISLSELAAIAGGRIRNWRELGGEDAPIRAILPPEGSSLDTTFTDLVLEPNRIRLRRTAERAETTEAAMAEVMSDPTAVSVIGLTETGDSRVVPIRQVCGPLAHATDFAVKAEEYPLSRRIYGYTPSGGLGGSEGAFLDYLVSDAASAAIAKVGFIDQSVSAAPLGDQGSRLTSAILTAETTGGLQAMQDLTRTLATAERLSATFRFTSGSTSLDNKALDDLGRVVDYLNGPEGRRRDIFILGFTDNVGRFDLNQRLALQRANAVRDALVTLPNGDALVSRISVDSYGPLAPVGCNETAEGRESNRRVEVWLR